MRALFAIAAIVGCASPAEAPPPIAHAPPPIDCGRAGASIASIVGAQQRAPYVASCHDDRWSDYAVACFARTAAIGDVVTCAAKLDAKARDALFTLLEDPRDERVFAAIHAARIAERRTGIAECDAFIAAVARAFACEAIPLDDRMLLGDVTTDFPVDSENPRLRARFAELCAKSLAGLQQQTALVGCGS